MPTKKLDSLLRHIYKLKNTSSLQFRKEKKEENSDMTGTRKTLWL